MGRITPQLFDVMGIPWRTFPDCAGLTATLDTAMSHFQTHGTPFGLIMTKGAVNACPLEASFPYRPPDVQAILSAASDSQRDSLDANDVLRDSACERATDALVATTGHTGRALYALEDRPNQFYMVGSMGCAASLGLGLAIAQPQRRIVVIDGDGAALMRLGRSPRWGIIVRRISSTFCLITACMNPLAARRPCRARSTFPPSPPPAVILACCGSRSSAN